MYLDKYQKWIHNYKGEIFRKCVEVCNEMKEVFPELEIKKGYVRILDDGGRKEYPHMWLELDNRIIDPTKNQWVGIMRYREYLPRDKIPIGTCANCGNQIYGYLGDISETVCSDKCMDEYVQSLNTEGFN